MSRYGTGGGGGGRMCSDNTEDYVNSTNITTGRSNVKRSRADCTSYPPPPLLYILG